MQRTFAFLRGVSPGWFGTPLFSASTEGGRPGLRHVRPVAGKTSPDAPRPGVPSPALTPDEGADDSLASPNARGGEPRPFVTYVLMALNIAIFLAMLSVSRGRMNGWTDNFPPEVTDVFGDKNNDLIRGGAWWRLVTPIFLHGGVVHLFSNMLSLMWLGGPIERIYGARKYLLVYLIAGVTGNLMSYAFTPGPSLGASGAIFGLIGAGLIFPIRFRALVPERARSQILSQLLMVAVINFAIGSSVKSIDNMAHLGGFIGGGIMALFLIPDVLEDRLEAARRNPRLARARDTGLWLAVILAVATVLLAAGLQARSVRGSAPPPMTTVYFGGRDPWWSLGLPSGWRQVEAGGWRGPDNAVIQIKDSLSAPQLVQQEAALVAQAGEKAQALTIDGKPARRLALENPRAVVEIFLIRAYDQFVTLTFVHPVAASARLSRDVALILASVRIVHPPTPGAIAAPYVTGVPTPNTLPPPVVDVPRPR